MHRGYLALVLHAHLPYVRHPEHPRFLEEDWLYEAISETYIPLLFMFDKLAEDGVPYKAAISLTPPLCEMLTDELLVKRYTDHVERLIDLSAKEVVRHKNNPPFDASARMYLHHFQVSRTLLVEKYKGNLLAGFKALQDAGHLDIMTCGATHGFLPLIVREEAKRAQIVVAKRNYQKHFGRPPAGIWLPECGFSPGDDRLLADAGLKFFFMDSHGVVYGTPRPRYGIFAPIRTDYGLNAFARDVESSRQIWSATEGYPGDYNYREFYRDLGYDGDYPYVKPFLHPDGVRRNIGLKYYRVTGKVELNQKQPYVPAWATERATSHASHFMYHRELQIEHLHDLLGREPCVVSAFDAELFGHWWFEGPQFLNFLIRKIAYDQDRISLTNPTAYLAANADVQKVTPSMSTWGAGGYNRVWLNGVNEWMYRHQHVAEERMVELANDFPAATGWLERALNQAARELLLAESSDWAFIMTTGTSVPYAQKRFRDHIHRFTKIYDGVMQNNLDREWLAEVEGKDNIFREIDYNVYRTK
ncbi:MAG: DUF1957 domain-containing protein [Acidobacteria bacterium]|nr:DUF1957 domain-containing protein [Acidobacteriota bacterium]